MQQGLRFLLVGWLAAAGVACTAAPDGQADSGGQAKLPIAPGSASAETRQSGDRGQRPSDFSDVKKSTLTLKVYDREQNKIGQGSGFYIGSGRVVTNAHVVRGGAFVEMYNDNGHRVGSAPYALHVDPQADLAILPAPDLPVPALEAASRQPRSGEAIWTVGSPLGFADSLSNGIVSAIRTIKGRQYLQITAPISPGSSGGPVVTAAGEVLGVVVAQIKKAQNINFAIPYGQVRTALATGLKRQPFPPKQVDAAQSDWLRSLLTRMLLGDPVNIGGRYRKRLKSGSDTRVGAASYFKLDIPRNRPVRITVASRAFDPAIMLVSKASLDRGEPWITNDDNSGPGDTAQLVGTVPNEGVHFLMIRAADGRGGDYGLEVTPLGQGRRADGDDRWRYLDKSADLKVYIDPSSATVDNGHIFVWLKFAHEMLQRTKGKRYDTTISRQEIDCRTRRYRLRALLLRRKGRNIGSSQYSAYESQWKDAFPDTIGDAFISFVCDR